MVLTNQIVDKVYASNNGAKITHPGSMQWYYIHEKGTYWINSFNDGVNVAFDVYEDDDLSNPIQPYHGEVDIELGKRFVTTRPIFIRVYAADASGNPDRVSTGNYQIYFHRATGATPWDSIALADRHGAVHLGRFRRVSRRCGSTSPEPDVRCR